jgi:GDPmannose 4,6-dehydratase
MESEPIMAKEIAVIVGALGQDGSYLAEFLQEKGYFVIGIIRKNGNRGGNNCQSFIHAYSHIAEIDISNQEEVETLLIQFQPTEIYYLATTNESPLDFSHYDAIFGVNTRSLAIFLDIIARHLRHKTRIFYAASCNIFMGNSSWPQNEHTEISPLTLYGLAKASGMALIKMYRSQYGVFGSSGILYNHESIRRRPTFLLRKVSLAVAHIALGFEKSFALNNLDSIRDWGHTRDYVRAMWMILQAQSADDFIVSTGVGRTVRDLIEIAFSIVGLDYENHVTADGLKSAKSVPLVGNNNKIKESLGWEPKITFEQIICEMIEHDKNLIEMKQKY